MDLLEPLVDRLLPAGGRRSRKLLEQGEVATATVAGLRRETRTDDSPDRWTYALVLADGTRLGVRQLLSPDRERVRIGGEVVVRHRDGKAIIDWPATLRRMGVADVSDAHALGDHKAVDPPADGIEDRAMKLKGDRATATLVSAEPLVVLGMATQNVRLVLDLAGARHELGRELVPDYARHLLVAGSTLPVAVDGRKVRIDWAAAATAAPG